jgi:CubicO group peptidase (beta-lactamase class C family)
MRSIGKRHPGAGRIRKGGCTGWNDGYGYLWWLPGDQALGAPRVYAALGYGGQFLFVVPERDLVAVFTGWNIYGTRSSLVRDLFLEEILPAAGGS